MHNTLLPLIPRRSEGFHSPALATIEALDHQHVTVRARVAETRDLTHLLMQNIPLPLPWTLPGGLFRAAIGAVTARPFFPSDSRLVISLGEIVTQHYIKRVHYNMKNRMRSSWGPWRQEWWSIGSGLGVTSAMRREGHAEGPCGIEVIRYNTEFVPIKPSVAKA
jgi:hypothetical protein